MDRLLFSFITGSLSSLYWPALLPTWSIAVLAIGAYISFTKHWYLASGGLAGVLWMLSVGYWLELKQPDESLFSQRILVTGEVVSVVTGFDQGKFEFVTEKFSVINGENWHAASHKLRLSWRKPDFALAQGQSLQLEVKIKPRWGLANEAGFDYQKWQLSRNIAASGYVVASDNNRLLHNDTSIRQQLANKLITIGVPEVSWLLALGIGYRSALTDTDWQLLQVTGTSHLVAISGMHLGMVALWSYVFFIVLLALANKALNRQCCHNIRRTAIIATLVPGCLYALLAGFSVPTLRALLMLSLACCLMLGKLNWRFSRFVLFSVACFILIFPLSIFSMSFWLSFGAIVIITFLLWRFPFRVPQRGQQPVRKLMQGIVSKFWYFVKLQLGVTLLMIPLVLLLFGGTSLISPIVNIIAVPLVTLLLLPMSLLAMLLILFDSNMAWSLLNILLRLFLEAKHQLEAAGSLSFAWFDIGTVDSLPVFLAALGLLLLVMPKMLIPRGFYFLLFVPFFTGFYNDGSEYVSSKSMSWQLDILDVGQGLSILIRKNGHAVLYDTGAAFPSGFSMADAVILPILKQSNIRYLDKLIISHDDNDHAGGVDVIRDAMPVAEYRRSPGNCHKDSHFSWKGLQFDVFWPDMDSLQPDADDNNLSCVIKISDGEHSVLLAGDIEYSVERLLVHLHRQNRIDLQSDFLVVPHHGSKTSSTASFIQAVSPQFAFVSAGFRNRWRMPANEVLARYYRAGIKVLNTAEAGQIRVIFSEHQQPEVSSWRLNQHSRWYLRL